MDKIWLANYPAGVPAEVDVDAFRSIDGLFARAVERFAAKDAFVSMGAAITFAELDRLSRDFAAFLQSDLKLPRGARVALMMPNILQYPVALFGALRAGCAVVNCNPLYTPRELRASSSSIPARRPSSSWRISPMCSKKCLPRTPQVEHVIVTGVGDMLGAPTRTAGQFRRAQVRQAHGSGLEPAAARCSSARRCALGARADVR